MFSLKYSQNFFIEYLPMYVSCFPGNIRLDENVLKMFISSSSEDAFKASWRRLHQDEYILLSDSLQKTSSSRFQDAFKTPCQNVFKTSSKRLLKRSSRHLQGVLKTFWRRLEDILCDVFARHLENIFKMSSRCLGKISSRHFQDVFKTYHQVSIEHVFETYCENNYLQKNLPGSHFWEVCGYGTKYSRMNSLDILKLLNQFLKTIYEVTRYYY